MASDARPPQEQEPQPFVPATPQEQEHQIAQLLNLAKRLASVGRLAEAHAHLATASAANPMDRLLSLDLAALQAWLGQDKEFAATRRKILAFAKDTNQGMVAASAATACSILPATDKADLEAALALGRTAVQLQRNGSTLLALGMAEYRSTNDAAAQEALLAAANADPSDPRVTGIAAFYRAMSLFRQGKHDEARKVALAAPQR